MGLHERKPEWLKVRMPGGERHAELDVDAIGKTAAIRFKQGVFKAVNSSRAALRGDLRRAVQSVSKAASFAFSTDEYNRFDEIPPGYRGKLYL